MTATELETTSWMAEGACAGSSGDVFHPVPGQGYEEARRVCHGCRVRDVCLAHTLAAGEAHGMWGGMTPVERKKLRRRT